MLKLIFAALLIAPALPARAGKVKMCLDEACTKEVKREKLDCTIHKNKRRGLTLGFKLSAAFLVKVGPEVSFARNTEIQWNGLSQEIIRRYEELCDMHNSGHLSVAVFNQRYEKLESFYERTKELKQEIQSNVIARAKKAFDDLDIEASKYNSDGTLRTDWVDPKIKIRDEMKGKIQKYSQDIDVLAKESKDFDKKPGEKEAEAGDS